MARKLLNGQMWSRWPGVVWGAQIWSRWRWFGGLLNGQRRLEAPKWPEMVWEVLKWPDMIWEAPKWPESVWPRYGRKNNLGGLENGETKRPFLKMLVLRQLGLSWGPPQDWS